RGNRAPGECRLPSGALLHRPRPYEPRRSGRLAAEGKLLAGRTSRRAFRLRLRGIAWPARILRPARGGSCLAAVRSGISPGRGCRGILSRRGLPLYGSHHRESAHRFARVLSSSWLHGERDSALPCRPTHQPTLPSGEDEQVALSKQIPKPETFFP